MIDLKTDIMETMTEEERIKIFLWCKENLKFIYDSGDNWVIFADEQNFCYSIAKPKTGALNSRFGSLSYAENIFYI